MGVVAPTLEPTLDSFYDPLPSISESTCFISYFLLSCTILVFQNLYKCVHGAML